MSNILEQLASRVRKLETAENPVIYNIAFANVTTPPTQLEIDAAFGATAAQLRDGWSGIIYDNISGLAWICTSANDAWQVMNASSTGGISGSGIAGRITQWTGVTTLGSSTLIKSGAGILTLSSAGAYTATVPETMTLAGRDVANTFTVAQTIQAAAGTQLTLGPVGAASTISVSAAGLVTVISAAAPGDQGFQINGETWISSNGSLAMLAERITSGTSALESAASFRVTSTGAPADGFGPLLSFLIKGNVLASTSIAAIGASRYGADNTGKLLAAVYNAGTFTRVGVFIPSGALFGAGIGATTVPSAPLHAYSSDATAGVSEVLRITHVKSSGAGANNIGAGIGFEVESATSGTNIVPGYVEVVAPVATLASYTGRLDLYAQDFSAKRTGVSVLATGSSVLCGIATSAQNSTLDINGSIAIEIRTVNSNTTLLTSDCIVLVNAAGGSVTITLPAASSCTGRIYVIKKVDSSANSVTVDGNSTETIDGQLTQAILIQYESMSIVSDGSGWNII